MPITTLIPALLAALTLLALGFHRHRAAQFALLLLLLAAAMGSDQPRWQEGALRFLPLFALISALMPEGRLLSRRHALWLAGLALLAGTTADAPERLFISMADAAAGPLADWRPEQSAAAGLSAAALVCLLRWALRAWPIELGSAFALGFAALAVAAVDQRNNLFMAAALSLTLAVLYGSYRMAFLDQLTGLPNRRALDETLGRLSGEYRLAMLDVDHFKNYSTEGTALR